MSDAVIAARLDLIAAKAKILSERYKNNQLWDGELNSGLNEISEEIRKIGSGRRDTWSYTDDGTWGTR